MNKKVFDTGRKAWYNGVELVSNPYIRSAECDEWFNGWYAAHEENGGIPYEGDLNVNWDYDNEH